MSDTRADGSQEPQPYRERSRLEVQMFLAGLYGVIPSRRVAHLVAVDSVLSLFMQALGARETK